MTVWSDWGTWSPTTWNDSNASVEGEGPYWNDLVTWENMETWWSTGTAPTPQPGDTYWLLSPVRELGVLSRDPFFELTRNRVGKTVVKRDGEWRTVRNKRQEWLDECDVVFRGGYENEVTETQRDELELAGYTVETRNE